MSAAIAPPERHHDHAGADPAVASPWSPAMIAAMREPAPAMCYPLNRAWPHQADRQEANARAAAAQAAGDAEGLAAALLARAAAARLERELEKAGASEMRLFREAARRHPDEVNDLLLDLLAGLLARVENLEAALANVAGVAA